MTILKKLQDFILEVVFQMLDWKVYQAISRHQLVVFYSQDEFGDAGVFVTNLLQVGFAQLIDFPGPVEDLVHSEYPAAVGGYQDALALVVRFAHTFEKFLKNEKKII